MRQVRSKAQLTLPEEITRALRISEGDEVEFCVHEDGTVTVRGYVSIPTDQAWFFTPQWLAGEREADEDIAAGGGRCTSRRRRCSLTWTCSARRMPDAGVPDASPFRAGLEGPHAAAAGDVCKAVLKPSCLT